MGALKLTQRNIEALKASAVRDRKDVFGWDTEVKGFGVKASPKGAVSYVVQKSIGGRAGKRKRIVIGHYPAKDLDTARKEAGKAVSDVHDGIDIADVKRQTKLEQAERLTNELLPTFETYLKKKSEPGRFWPEVESIYRNHIIPALGKSTPIAAISKSDVRKLIEAKEATHPDAARNWFAFLRPFFKWCVERDIIPVSPMENLVPPKVSEARDRILNEHEIKAFWLATCNMPYPFGPFYQLLLLTAQRREEVAGMGWTEVDLKKGEWIIPKERTKNGKEHLVHLSPEVVTTLKWLKAEHTNGPYVFSTNGKTPISGYSKAKAKLDTLCAAAAEEWFPEFLPQIFQLEWRVHDLRRTAASGMAALGFQPHIVERVLNHVQGGIVSVYQRFEYADERKRAIEAWGSRVAALASGQDEASNVVSIKTGER